MSGFYPGMQEQDALQAAGDIVVVCAVCGTEEESVRWRTSQGMYLCAACGRGRAPRADFETFCRVMQFDPDKDRRTAADFYEDYMMNATGTVKEYAEKCRS